jgi:hypothetical protein
MQWLPEDAKYHILQACLNEISSLFGPNFVYFNAVDGETSNCFKSTWYCLTVMTPTRPASKEPRRSKEGAEGKRTCTFTDMTRMPRATLRIALVNETELRRIADGKLRPPSYGFFNDRHAERFRMLTDFGRNFQKQLVRTSADARSIGERNPFTSEKVHSKTGSSEAAKPDDMGCHMKRVHSVPNMSMAAAMSRSSSRGSKEALLAQSSGSPDLKPERRGSQDGRWEQAAEEERGTILSENNCFLRIHVPHYIGHDKASTRPPRVEDLPVSMSSSSLNFGPKRGEPSLSPAGNSRRSAPPPGQQPDTLSLGQPAMATRNRSLGNLADASNRQHSAVL